MASDTTTQPEFEIGDTVRVESENRRGEIYRKPPYSESVKAYDSEGEDGEIQVMLLHDDGTYDMVLTCTPDELEIVD